MKLHVCSCTYMFRQCIYQVHTWHVQVHYSMNKYIEKYKKGKEWDLNS